MLDTAAVAFEVLHAEPERTRSLYGGDLQSDVDAALKWVAALAGAHDIGKASPAFQGLWEEGRRRCEAAGLVWTRRSEKESAPHGVIGQKVLGDWLTALGWQPEAARRAADAVGAHHGYRYSQREVRGVRSSVLGTDEGWSRVREDLLHRHLQALAVGHAPPIDGLSPEGYMRLAGLASFCDWIASDADLFPFGRDPSDPTLYLMEARSLARIALRRIWWPKTEPLLPAPKTFNEVFGFPPREIQSIAEAETASAFEPSLVLVEAPMGEGKTEAALMAHLNLQRNLGHRGIYVAMPTQATGNAMFQRVKDLLANLGFEDATDLMLVHGAAWMEREQQSARPSEVNRDGSASEDVSTSEWFSQRKRPLLVANGVGTVDQALMADLNAKHQFVRLWGLGNRTIVFDEVHAYDVYTSALIEGLVMWAKALGSSVVLLSATLPKAKRLALLRAFGAEDDCAVPYPRMTLVSGSAVNTVNLPSHCSARVWIEEAPIEPKELAAFLLSRAVPGSRVGCIVNTVGRAQKIYRELQAAKNPATDLDLFHARYPATERRRRERQAIRRYGKDSDRGEGARILVSTQVAEQSLNLDFDLLVTDLAPVDLVLQRMGRLHRYAVPRPAGMERPVVCIAGLARVQELPNLVPARYVYHELLLLRTWLALREVDEIGLPHDIEALIERVYGDELFAAPGALGERLRLAEEDFAVQVRDDRRTALGRMIPEPEAFFDRVLGPETEDSEDPFRPSVLRPQTRLGRPSVIVVPLYRRHDGGATLDDQGRWPVNLEDVTRRGVRRLLRRSINVSHPEVFSALGVAEVPAGWGSQALLRYVKPLWLKEDGAAEFGRTRVRLDPDLGLEYTRKGEDE